MLSALLRQVLYSNSIYAPIEDGFVIRAIGSDSNAELETQEIVEWLNVFVRNEQNHPNDCWRIEKDGQFALKSDFWGTRTEKQAIVSRLEIGGYKVQIIDSQTL